jgi:uncharacterized protein
VEKELLKKYEKLLDAIRFYRSAAIAFSGGVDSSLLLYAAAEALGRENILCVTARAASFPEREFKEAEAFCESLGALHEAFDFNELGVEGFAANPENRCYLCKFELFSEIIELAKGSGWGIVFEGSNTDDEGDYRPGMKAIAELGVRSPLLEAGLGKDDIRAISKELGLKTWDKPSFACLASRFAYGEEITGSKLDMVGRAEQFLLEKGFSIVRVRINGERCFTARIETRPEDIAVLAGEPLRSETVKYFEGLGFTYVTLDLCGYRTGSMNEGLCFSAS